MELRGASAIVTGASSGIGREVCAALGEKGAHVALLARRPDKLEETKKQVEDAGGRALVCAVDVTDPQQITDAVRRTAEEFGRIDIVANIAGMGIFKNIEEMSIDEWDSHINVMLRGAFLVTKHALPHLYRQKRGHIITVTSLWAKRFCGKCAGYTAAKFGVRGLMQSLREEARAHNVKVTNIMPGTVNTPFFENALWDTDLSRALQPRDVAQTVVFALEMPDRAAIEELELQAIQPDTRTV
jgi:NADP-dependent 3-hydroxy acid dehydrogenase YdfG